MYCRTPPHTPVVNNSPSRLCKMSPAVQNNPCWEPLTIFCCIVVYLATLSQWFLLPNAELCAVCILLSMPQMWYDLTAVMPFEALIFPSPRACRTIFTCYDDSFRNSSELIGFLLYKIAKLSYLLHLCCWLACSLLSESGIISAAENTVPWWSHWLLGTNGWGRDWGLWWRLGIG